MLLQTIFRGRRTATATKALSVFPKSTCETFRIPVSQSGVKVSKVVDVPKLQLLDGLAIVNQPDGLLMSADAQTGALYLIDIQKRTANGVLQDELLDGTTDEVAAALAHIGTNGL